jgi:hypothetical protein
MFDVIKFDLTMPSHAYNLFLYLFVLRASVSNVSTTAFFSPVYF